MGETRKCRLSKPVFFIGFMGSGKSSVACALARNCALPFCDLDALIVERAGRSVTQIFEDEGEGGFRDLEAAELRAVATGEPRVVACGGGIVERPENIATMREAGYVVHLDIDFDEAAKRIGSDPDRPLFANREQARSLAETREALYHQAADLRLDTAGRSIEEVARAVASALLEAGVMAVGEGR